MKKISVTAWVGLGLLWSGVLFASDLWISVLSLPPQPGMKGFGIYVHCPDSRKQSLVELYEFLDFHTKTKIDQFTAGIFDSGTNLLLSAPTDASELLTVTIDRSKSFAVAPFHYHGKISLDPSVYPLTPHQSTISARILNPAYPEYSDQPAWGENLSDCGIKLSPTTQERNRGNRRNPSGTW